MGYSDIGTWTPGSRIGDAGNVFPRYREFQYYDTLWQFSGIPTIPGLPPL